MPPNYKFNSVLNNNPVYEIKLIIPIFNGSTEHVPNYFFYIFIKTDP